MKAWRLEKLGGKLTLEDISKPEPRPGSVLVKIEAAVLLSYMKAYVEGSLPAYKAPETPFTPGSNAVGVIEAVGRDVWHLKAGERVVTSPYLVSGEHVEEPAQFLMGLTSFGGASDDVQEDWPDGVFAEYALLPAACLTTADGLDHLESAQLGVLSRCIVPYGGLLRGRLATGETLVVNGATGAYGTAAVLVAIAMGAGRVIAAGRRADALEAVARAAGSRVVPVALTGNVEADAAALRDAAGGGAHMAFDMVGQADDPASTLSALGSLRRNGRLVLMGSMTTPLPISYGAVMLSNIEILGQFMYPPGAYRRLLGLLRGGFLDIAPIRPRVFPLAALPEAINAAAAAGNLECVMLRPEA